MKESKILKMKPPILGLYFLLGAIILNCLSPRGFIFFFPFGVLAFVSFIAGLVMMSWAFLIFRKEKAELSPLIQSKKFIVHGPYKYTRNPMYLGMVLILLGIAFGVCAIPMFLPPLALFITLNDIFIPHEEAKLEKEFGKVYLDYKKKVRRWI